MTPSELSVTPGMEWKSMCLEPKECLKEEHEFLVLLLKPPGNLDLLRSGSGSGVFLKLNTVYSYSVHLRLTSIPRLLSGLFPL